MKAANSYASLLKGVSQQVPQDRAEGQHTEQVNMLSDPVNGLTRRHGSVMQGVSVLSNNAAELAAFQLDTENWLSYDFDSQGREFVVLYRTGTRVAGATNLPPIVVYDKATKLFLNYNRNAADAALDTLSANGVSALTGLGKYLFMAAKGVPVAGSSVAAWDVAPNNRRAVAWIRGGAYSRRYEIEVGLVGGGVATAQYTTPSSSYPIALNTSSIPAAAPDYTKQVNDMVNAYNSAVTAWIGTAAAAIQPEAIAEELRSDLAFIGGVSREGSTITFDNITSLSVDDGGDGTLALGVHNEVESASKVSAAHWNGKIVKVRGKNAAEAFYLKALSKVNPNATGVSEVTWSETGGVNQSITGGLFYATVAGNTLHVASTAALLNNLIAGPAPTFTPSGAGDLDSAPAPFFVGQQVTYLGVLQSRLLIGSGGVLALSKTNDYLNFYRSTVLTLPNDDPFEMLPQGSEDDELRYGTLYDQDLVIFGKKRQYVIRGDQPLTPTSANMPVMSSYEDTAQCPPVAAGGFIMYAKRGVKYSSLFQIQPGQAENSPESFPASSQIDSYIRGNAVQLMVTTGSPSILLMKTSGARNSLYSFAYLDKPDGRKMDAWSRWDFPLALGVVAGAGVDKDGILVFTMRQIAGGRVAMVADLCPITTGLSDAPYLDSMRPWADVLAGAGDVVAGSGTAWAAAFTSASNRRFTGTLLPSINSVLTAYPGEPGLVVGAVSDAYVELTNPYMRDSKDKAILTGRLTITKKVIAFRNTIGFGWRLQYGEETPFEREFNGRILGADNNVIGVEPISDGQFNIPIGRETRKYSLRIMARRWYPLTITAVEWVGQFFNRVQRF